MDVIVTGAYGRVGTAVLDHATGKFDYVPFDRRDHPRLDTVVGDVSDLDTVQSVLDSRQAVVHLAANPHVDADWESVLRNNIAGAYNCLEACRQCGVKTAVLASSNHIVGMYEQEHAPSLYEQEYDLFLNHETPVRPDSFYGVSKAFLEALGRYYVENYDSPSHVYALRIGSVRYPEYDHPFGDAERGVEAGRWERGSDEYRREVRRMKAVSGTTTQSSRYSTALVRTTVGGSTSTARVVWSGTPRVIMVRTGTNRRSNRGIERRSRLKSDAGRTVFYTEGFIHPFS